MQGIYLQGYRGTPYFESPCTNCIIRDFSFNELKFVQYLSNFNLLRKEVLNFIPNFSKLNELPVYKDSLNKKNESEFISEEISIKELDYFYTNSISRASKTMSKCRQISQNSKKTGTNN